MPFTSKITPKISTSAAGTRGEADAYAAGGPTDHTGRTGRTTAPKSAPVAMHADPTPVSDDTASSTPEAAAATVANGDGKAIGALVYFSSASENTSRFVASCRLPELGINVYRIPLKPGQPPLRVHEPYLLMVPTYGGGDAAKAVPVQVKKFLNNAANRAWIRGVIASGNTNFGSAYAAAGDIIAAKCRVPYLYRFELMGTREDTRKVREGIVRFFRGN